MDDRVDASLAKLAADLISVALRKITSRMMTSKGSDSA
jgi:hypothetical protein